MFNRVRLRLFRMPFEHHAYDRPVSRLVLQPVRPTASGAPVRLLSGPGDSCTARQVEGWFHCSWRRGRRQERASVESTKVVLPVQAGIDGRAIRAAAIMAR
jgi:hypothetical protein